MDKLQNIRTNPTALLISLDVDSLRKNLENEMGMKAVTEAFNRDPKPIHKCILKLLRLSLEGNDFSFNNKYYLQTSGTAMGKQFAPNYANIYMTYFKAQNLPKCDKQPLS